MSSVVTASGQTQSWMLVTDVGGTAVFSLVNLGQTAEYTATANGVTSNAIQLNPLFP
jgi:hypothetical protein